MGDEDKQFEASHQKLQQARKQGQVVKSKDLSTALFLLVMCFLVSKLSPFIWDQVTRLFVLTYEQIPNVHLDKIGSGYLCLITILPTVLIIAPILFVAWCMGIFGDFIQVGPLVTTTPLMPKLTKLNPVSYFKNLFSKKTVFDLFKNIIKIAILGYIGWMVYSDHLEAILGLAAIDNNFAVMTEFGNLIMEFITKAMLAFFIIACADYMQIRQKFMNDQKMSLKEVKDEYKSSEGDPNVKAQLRQRRMQMLQQDAVADCDFVVTNPTHIACALKYDPEKMESPKLVAKGTELIAKKIIEIAKEHDIPVVENPPVARALFRMVELNAQIPPDLYKAVAEILLFVYNLKGKNKLDNIKNLSKDNKK